MSWARSSSTPASRRGGAVYREDLARHPANGWALSAWRAAGGAEAQHRGDDGAEPIRHRLKRADITLRASAF